MKQGIRYRVYKDFKNHNKIQRKKPNARNFERYITIVSQEKDRKIEASENIKGLIP